MTRSTTVPAGAPERLAADEARAIREAIERVIADGPWIGGPAVARFEEDFGAASSSEYVVGVGNGTDALTLAMLALDLPRGSGVLVGANEGGYAATAARAVGLRPVVADVGESMSIEAREAEEAMTPDVAAIVVTHLHGDAADLTELDRWRRARGLAMIEDCAQAHGASVGGRPVGTTGEVAAYSFYPTKNLGAIGDAGAVATDDPARAQKARQLREYGWDEHRRAVIPGGRNSRLDPLQAAVLSARLPWLDRRNERRRGIANRYRSAVEGSGIRIHGDADETVAHHAVVLTDHRDELADFLSTRGVAVAVHYPYLLTEMPGLQLGGGDFPRAERFRDTMLSLPCFPELTDDEVDQVVAALTDWIHHD